MEYGKTVKSYLQEHGISQVWLADKCGWTKQRANNLLNGRTVVTATDADTICSVLGVPAGFFANDPDGVPVTVGEKEYHQIVVTDSNGEVIVVITGDSVVEHKGYSVILS